VANLLAATIVHQVSVEECLSVVENNMKGVAQFNEISLVSSKMGDASSTSIYKLEGYNVYGDIAAGSWEISVEVYSAEEGQSYKCKIVKNEE
jgi:uncharacterized protein YjfI (DUF2170 family)